MDNWYCTRQDVKDVLSSDTKVRDAAIAIAIPAASRAVDALLALYDGRFIPQTQTKRYDFPWRSVSWRLRLHDWLISLTTLTGESATATAIPTSEVFLEPVNEGPPYRILEIDQASTNAAALFQAGDTHQRAIAVTGSWGFWAETVAASALGAAIADATATSAQVKDGSKVAVGHTLLIASEQLFVSAMDYVDIAQNESGALNAAKNDQELTLGGAPADAVAIGEELRIDSEEMRVTGITSATVFTVDRAVNGTTIAAHTDATDVFVKRTLTVTRGVNGTTADAQSDDATITSYRIPADIKQLVIAEVLASGALGLASYQDVTPAGRGIVTSLDRLRDQVLANLRYGLPMAA